MDKMREEFEDWFYADSLPCEADWFSKDDDGEYTYDPTYWGWKAWKASRAALCVELPDNLDGEYYADGWNACLMATADKLEAQGVSSK